jgi:modified peptide precursor CbpA
MTPVPVRPVVIAYRKACQPTGVGLSHYVLLTNTAQRKNAPDKTNVR